MSNNNASNNLIIAQRAVKQLRLEASIPRIKVRTPQHWHTNTEDGVDLPLNGGDKLLQKWHIRDSYIRGSAKWSRSHTYTGLWLIKPQLRVHKPLPCFNSCQMALSLRKSVATSKCREKWHVCLSLSRGNSWRVSLIESRSRHTRRVLHRCLQMLCKTSGGFDSVRQWENG